MNSSNLDKSIHGMKGQYSLGELIESFVDKGYIKDYISPYRMGYPNKEKQFYFQFAIIFNDGEAWLLQSTTSIRERINIQQWHAEHMKTINNLITKAYVVYPDGIDKKELIPALAYNSKITNNTIHSELDGIISQTELYNLIEEKALQTSSAGSAKAIKGFNFEERIADILSNRDNFIKWKYDDKRVTGLFYADFEMIMRELDLDPDDVEKLFATADDKRIGRLPSGGKPKTDVILYIKWSDQTVKVTTFSCKRTSDSWVTAHQYSAKSFCEVLDIRDKSLQHALNDFQAAGGLGAFGEENTEYLTNALVPYHERLALWVYGGIGGGGDPLTQWAKYIITYKNDSAECFVHSIREYVGLMEQAKIKGHFGTIFKWTYASGEKGKSIQLKTMII